MFVLACVALHRK